MPLLTIAIPTFNRAPQLEERLRELEPQITDQVTIRIFNNASTDDTAAVVERFAHLPIRYSCSEFNLGAVRNVIRCFEETDTEWVWPLSDDDALGPNALSTILAKIAASEADIINFQSHGGPNPEEKLVSNIEEFYRYKLDPSTLSLISASVYRRARLKPLFKLLVPGAFTLVPHALVILTALETGAGKLLLTTENPFVPVKLTRGLRWSSREYSLGVSLLPEFLATAEAQRLTARALRAATRWMLFFALREVQTREDVGRWKRIVKLVNTNLSSYGGTPRWELKQRVFPPRQQFKQTVGTRVACLLPAPLLLRLALYLRRRWTPPDLLEEFR